MRAPFRLLAVLGILGLVGCGSLEMSTEGDPARVLTGQVDMGEAGDLPADTVVTVRILDNSVMPPLVLGSQTIKNPGAFPVDFRVEYVAQDEVLRHGLNIEARVSWGGKVRYYNLNSYAVTLGNASDPHRVSVNRADK